MSSRKPRVVVPSPRRLAMKEIQLIDRVEEMDILREAVDKVVHGEGGVVFLYGEAGIGKTRLARELGAYARSRGMQVLSGRCPALFRMNGVPPYVLWEEVIKDYMDVCTLEELHKVIGSYPIEVSKLIPELKQKLRLVPESFPLSPEHSRDRLFEAVTQFITNISREKPLLVILDDLQWTDQSSLLLLHYLARGVYRESLLLLGAYRDIYVDEKHPLSPVLKELNRERLLQSVRLKRLSFDDVSEMTKRILEQDDAPREFCELVYEKTRGNPFFVEEVIKSLKEEEVIYRKGRKWEIKEVSKIKFPETVRDVIKTRIGRLDDECQNVLTMASFVGKDFTFDALSGVTGVEEDKLSEIMDKLLKTGFIKRREIRGEDMCSFADTLVRDAVHEEVGHFKRKKLHGVVGIALEKVYAKKIDEHLGELALHFLEGGDKDKAFVYFLKAAERAQKAYAHDETFCYLGHALVLLEEKEGDLEEKARIMERLGDIKAWIGEIENCLEHWNKSLTLWDQLPDERSVSRIHVKMASVFWTFASDKERASEHHRMALEILEKEPESIELARLYEDISHMLWRTGELAEALPWAQKAAELAERLGDPKVLTGCYVNLGLLSLNSGELEKALEYFEQSLKIAVENNRPELALQPYDNLSLFYYFTREMQKLFENAQKGSELARKVGDVQWIAWNDMYLALSYAFMGEVRRAISMLEDILALDKRTKNTAHLSYPLFCLGTCHCWLGEWDKSLQYLTEARDIAKKTGEFYASANAALFLGELFMEMEEYVEAEKYLNESNSIFEKAGSTAFRLVEVFPRLSGLHIEKGEVEKAKELIEKTYKHATKTKTRSLISYAEMLKAMLFREQKKWKKSLEYFERSLQEYNALNARRWNAYWFAKMVLCEYARVYLERDQEGDRKKAYDLLNQALEIFQKMGAKKQIEKVKSRMIYVETGRQIANPEPVAEVSEVVPSHVTTGYGDLDDLLFGGIPRNYAVILTSASCDERDLLIKRFLEAGAKNGEVTFYVTIDPGEANILTEEFPNFYLFICNPQADKIVKSLTNVFKLKGVENLTDINIALTSAFRKLDKAPSGPRRACIEIISDVLLQHHAVQTRRWLTGLLPELKSKGFTTLAVMDPEMHPQQEVRAIAGAFEGEINIYKRKTKKGLEKFLKIEKMYNRKYSKNELPLQEEKLQQ